MKITDVPCNCACGWSGTVGDCEPDVDGDGSLGCPICLKIVTCDKVYPPIVLSVNEVTIICDREAEFLDDAGAVAHPWPPLTVSITCHAPRNFRGERLLQAVDKRIKIRILEEE